MPDFLWWQWLLLVIGVTYSMGVVYLFICTRSFLLSLMWPLVVLTGANYQ